MARTDSDSQISTLNSPTMLQGRSSKDDGKRRSNERSPSKSSSSTSRGSNNRHRSTGQNNNNRRRSSPRDSSDRQSRPLVAGRTRAFNRDRRYGSAGSGSRTRSNSSGGGMRNRDTSPAPKKRRSNDKLVDRKTTAPVANTATSTTDITSTVTSRNKLEEMSSDLR